MAVYTGTHQYMAVYTGTHQYMLDYTTVCESRWPLEINLKTEGGAGRVDSKLLFLAGSCCQTLRTWDVGEVLLQRWDGVTGWSQHVSTVTRGPNAPSAQGRAQGPSV